jgi:opacity protein-like surface antigen
MRRFKVFATAWVCCVAMTAAAHAADMPGTWAPPVEKQVFTDLVSGWYVRGDIGYRQQEFGSIDAPAPDFVTNWSIRSTPTVGFGGGYKYYWFRADVTVDYGTRARFEGDTALAAAFYTARFDSYTILANVYLDLGEWAGFTPYVGVGGGTTNVRMDEFVIGSAIPAPASSKWNASWAAMAGVAYRVTPRIVIDVGYRYLSMGDALSGTEPPLYTTRTNFTDLTAQELRVGFRWVLD